MDPFPQGVKIVKLIKMGERILGQNQGWRVPLTNQHVCKASRMTKNLAHRGTFCSVVLSFHPHQWGTYMTR